MEVVGGRVLLVLAHCGVLGHDEGVRPFGVVVWQRAVASGSGTSAVAASSQMRLNMPERLL